MTYFYSLSSSMGQPQTPQITEETINIWKHLSKKKHWRIVQLPNGYFQTEHRDLVEKDKRQTHPTCLLYTSPSPRDRQKSRMPSSA